MQNINDSFYCPITYTVMLDPVIGSDGHTYERSAITQWLQNSGTSPITKQPMSLSNLVPNIALRDTISSFLSANPGAVNTIKQKPAELTDAIKRAVSIQAQMIDSSSLFVRVKATEESKRKPSVFVFVIDVSGSMNTEASVETKGESDGFTRLDLVKHSVRTVIEVLGDSDSICLITFSDDAKVVLDITKTNAAGKARAIQVLENIKTEGMTNIWDGLRVALLNVEKVTDPNVNISVVLLTDGEPNQNPPRGIIPTLSSAIESRKINQAFTINTFGYGYSLDSKLLTGISACGAGSYGYIPDSSMVGTIFVNYLSNVLATCLSNSSIRFTCDDSNVTISSQFTGEHIGSIIFDQPRELVYNVSGLTKPTNVKIELIVSKDVITSYEFTICPKTYNMDSSCVPSAIRYKIIETISNCIEKVESTNNIGQVNGIVKQFYDDISVTAGLIMAQSDTEKIQGFLQDYYSSQTHNGGQIEYAFSRSDWFSKWGKHFLRSIMNAYLNQQCNNFKDPGVQHFAGNLFNSIREIADDAFCMLPAPKPSRKSYSYGNQYSSGSRTTTAGPTNMSAYYDRSGGCFDGDGYVTMYNEILGDYYEQVKLLKPGQTVRTIINGQLTTTTIRCIVKSKVPNGVMQMCNIGNMLITPWHPVLVGSWAFPINLVESKPVQINYIYNIVLESGHVLFINACPVVTLGHNFTGQVVAHPYYGSQQIIQDLSQMDGWNEGFIQLDQPMIMRADGFVTKLLNGSAI